MAKQKIKKEYHIFSNEVDEWTTNYQKAVKIFNIFVKRYGCARLYAEEREEDGELLNEWCVKLYGEYPL